MSVKTLDELIDGFRTELNAVASVTPAGGGDISPAAANRSTSLAKNSGEVAAVVEPPKPEASPAKAGSDETENQIYQPME